MKNQTQNRPQNETQNQTGVRILKDETLDLDHGLQGPSWERPRQSQICLNGYKGVPNVGSGLFIAAGLGLGLG
jgi:hypothetical protein